MKEDENLLTVSVGTSRVAGSQSLPDVKKGPALSRKSKHGVYGLLPSGGDRDLQWQQPGKPVVCVTGEGSLQMNIQEFQTIIQNRLPIKLFVINNQGYRPYGRRSRVISAPRLWVSVLRAGI